MNSQQEELTGVVDKLLFQSEENGFSVFVLQLRGTNTVTVRGHLPTIQPGQQVSVQGFWVMHPKFGKQFEAKKCTACLPTTIILLHLKMTEAVFIRDVRIH